MCITCAVFGGVLSMMFLDKFVMPKMIIGIIAGLVHELVSSAVSVASYSDKFRDILYR